MFTDMYRYKCNHGNLEDTARKYNGVRALTIAPNRIKVERWECEDEDKADKSSGMMVMKGSEWQMLVDGDRREDEI